MELILDILLNPVVIALLKIVVIVLVFVAATGTVMTLMERKWMSAVQDRIGPNRANIPFLRDFRGRGALHMAADGLKSIFKEDTVPEGVDLVIFTIAPFFGFISAVVIWAVIPFAAPIGDFTFQITDVNIGILLVFAVTSLGIYGTVLAGWSSNNKYALLGAARGTSQMLSYEIFLGLSLVGVFMVNGSVQVSILVANQNTYWFGDVIPKWGLFTQPLAFVMFFTAMLAEAKRLPFDAPEGESEIIAGYFMEYSGMRYAAFMLAEYIAMVGIAALVTTLFLGGYHVPWLHAEGFQIFGWFMAVPVWLVSALQILAFVGKIIFFCWLIIMVRWTIPRFRFDQIMELGWKKLLPLSLANIVVTALVLLAVDNWNL
ncbi:MAG: NADH-quinone oxidoreductase subunit H [SAR324 cluster bacterium]|nr:NADH-quinone oxidoreductase subunit H [SAR324 cluster bacterium]MCZ6628606.1 NADH-quinone oxidoreductase subunit H [SAR324 cluster bacterium]